MIEQSLIQYSDLDARIIEVAKEDLKKEQVDCPVTHFFGPGVYIRECTMPANTRIIGHIHKESHTNVMLTGKLLMLLEDGSTELFAAPMVYVAPPGRKVALIVEDVTWQNIYATDETNIEILEALLFDNGDFPLPYQQEKINLEEKGKLCLE